LVIAISLGVWVGGKAENHPRSFILQLTRSFILQLKSKKGNSSKDGGETGICSVCPC